MRIMWNWQVKKYGTLVAAGIATGGALWLARTTTTPRAVDFFTTSQTILERCLATQTADGTNSIYTNAVVNWIADTNGYAYSTYTAAGVRVVTSYWQHAATTTDHVITNGLGGSTYRVAPLSWSRHSSGSRAPTFSKTGGRYIWGGYQTLTLGGFSSDYNGDYHYMTNGAYAQIDADVYDGDLSYEDVFNFLNRSRNPLVYVWTNANGIHLVDAGPMEGYPFYYGKELSVVLFLDPPAFSADYATFYGDSAINGPWFRPWEDRDDSPVSGWSVVGSDFSSNILRDAQARAWINRYNDEQSTWQSPRMVVRVTRYMFDNMRATLDGTGGGNAGNLCGGDLRILGNFYGSCYIDHTATNAGGTYNGITNWAGTGNTWEALADAVTWTSCTARASVSNVWPDYSDMTKRTNTYTYIGKICRDALKWTYRRMAGDTGGSGEVFWYPSPWDGSANNYFTGEGIAIGATADLAALWATAKTRAESSYNADTGTRFIFNGPSRYTTGMAETFGGGVRVWATVSSTVGDLVCKGINTNISHTVDFYVYGRSPGSNVFFNALGTGLGLGVYNRIASVGPTFDGYPHATLGTTNIPAWCAQPVVGGRTFDGWDVTRWSLPGPTFEHSEEAVIKWDFVYGTNAF